jgi:aspartyl-tRNA(Asn)/glutamyl-tRNA(Gln) amidotransferase subunit C
MSKLSLKDVKKVANLIKIKLDDAGLSSMLAQLEVALEPVEYFKELDTENVKPTFQTVISENRLRPDVVKPGLTQKQALSNAKETLDGYIVVKRFIKNGN